MQQPELLQPGIGKLEQQPRLGHGEGGKTLRKRLREKLGRLRVPKIPFFTQLASGKQEHTQESLQGRKIPPQCRHPPAQENLEQLLGFPGMRKRLWMCR